MWAIARRLSTVVMAAGITAIVAVGCSAPSITVKSETYHDYRFTGRERIFVYHERLPTEDQEHATAELTMQLAAKGFVLVDSVANADAVLEFYFDAAEHSGGRVFEFVDEHGRTSGVRISKGGKVSTVLRANLYAVSMWIDPERRMTVVADTVRVYSPRRIWAGRLAAPAASLAYKKRLPIYVDLLLSAFGKTVDEKHRIESGTQMSHKKKP